MSEEKMDAKRPEGSVNEQMFNLIEAEKHLDKTVNILSEHLQSVLRGDNVEVSVEEEIPTKGKCELARLLEDRVGSTFNTTRRLSKLIDRLEI